MPPLKILISGGGVAGTALAFWLSKLGHNVTVIEHYPSLRTTGLQIDLRSHGVEILRRMGLEETFRAHAAPEEGMQFIDQQGRHRAYLAAAKTGSGNQGITSEYEIMRGDLCRLIHDATKGKANYVFGTAVKSFKESEKGVQVEFKNGKSERFDLLVGADGVWSSTRKLMLGEEASKKSFHSLNETNAYLTFKQPKEKDERYIGRMYLATNKRALLLRRHNPEEMQLYLLLSRHDELMAKTKRGDVEAEKAAFAQIFHDAGWKTNELLEKMQQSQDFYCERLGVVKMDQWYQGHVALVGDAGYGPGGSGMGTTTAMMGAYILAGEIGTHCGRGDDSEDTNNIESSSDNIQAALHSYDTRFRPFMNKLHSTIDGSAGSWLLPTSAWGIAVFHLIVQLCAWMKLDVLAQYFMWEKKDSWKLPEYPVLKDSMQREEEFESSWK